MPLDVEIGLGSGDIVLDENPAPLQKGHSSPQFSAHVSCGQTVGWIKMPVGKEVGLGPGDVVLDGDPAPPRKRGTFCSMCIVAKRSPISVGGPNC